MTEGSFARPGNDADLLRYLWGGAFAGNHAAHLVAPSMGEETSRKPCFQARNRPLGTNSHFARFAPQLR
jgi:hypothetical protein